MYNCLYVLFYRGPLGRLANLAKSETLLKYCINKGLNCYQITSHRCILCAAETLKQEHCVKRCRSSILVLMAAILVEDIIRNIYVKLFVYDVQGMSF